jgi:hypothetical protein
VSKYAVLASDLDWFPGSILDGIIDAPAATPLFGSSINGRPREETPSRKLSILWLETV